MLKFNLMPHRAARRARLARQFYAGLAGALLGGAALVLLLAYRQQGATTHEEGQLASARQQLALLDARLAGRGALQAEIAALQERRQALLALQQERVRAAHLLAELAATVPPGVQLQTLRQQGGRVTLEGTARARQLLGQLLRPHGGDALLDAARVTELRGAGEQGELAFRLEAASSGRGP